MYQKSLQSGCLHRLGQFFLNSSESLLTDKTKRLGAKVVHVKSPYGICKFTPLIVNIIFVTENVIFLYKIYFLRIVLSFNHKLR